MLKTIFFLLLVMLAISCVDENNKQIPATSQAQTNSVKSCLTSADSTSLIKYEAKGCGDILVYGYLDSSHLLVVEIDRAYYNLTEDCTTIDLQPDTKGVSIKTYERPKGAVHVPLPVCTDVSSPYDRYQLLTDEFISGKIEASISKKRDSEMRHWCTVKVENLHLRKKGKPESREVKTFIFYNVLVGWIAG